MNSGDPQDAGKVDRFGYAAGLAFNWRPGDRRSSLRRMNWGLSAQYRRQYLPDVDERSAVKVDNLIVRASMAGGIGKVPGLKDGLGYHVAGAYDLNRKVPGLEMGVATVLFAYPRVVLGIDGWVQGHDDDPRTRDKRWDWAPRVSLQF
jgi:hypothetical protein